MNFSFNIYPKNQYVKLQTGFDILSTVFTLVGSSNMRFDYLKMIKYIELFEYIVNIFLNNILIHICDRLIFIFVFVKYVFCE